MQASMRMLIDSQVYLSHTFDKLLPEKYRIDGKEDYQHSLAQKYLKRNLKVYDVGGGKTPLIKPDLKKKLRITVVGIDIDKHELDRAPAESYDEAICADITQYRGNANADLVVCQTLLEHVKDVDKAFAAIASILKPGGVAAIFVPSKNAIYAKLSLILPEETKRYALYKVFPRKKGKQVFPSYYDRCTPRDIEIIAECHGLEIIEKRLYFTSSYFSFFFPAYFLWRIWILLFHFFAGDQAAETFSIAFRKN
jgi:SAM-dependent methyltransferase